MGFDVDSVNSALKRVRFSPKVEAALSEVGLTFEAPPGTDISAILGVPGTLEDADEVAPSAKPALPTDGYFTPQWYSTLRYAITSPNERGACVFGPRGTGKTTAVHRIAKETERPLVTFQAAAGCMIDDLIGMRDLRDGKTIFTPGPLPRALAEDAILLIEEANVMAPGVFSKLNTLTDGSGDSLYLPDGTTLSPGANFRVVLCFNEGASYSGTRDVNAALRDRLMPIYTDYLPVSEEVKMLVFRTKCDPASAAALVRFADAVRGARTDTGFDLSPRALMRVMHLIRDLKYSWTDAIKTAILDLCGDPYAQKPRRDVLMNLAESVSLTNAPLPVFEDAGGQP